ncbi:MAG: type II toxin-antitoxin system VapC family toxin [Candidatus Bathyarchaeia archaeon]
MSNELAEAVLDASILIQALVRERHTDAALRLLRALKAIYAPSLALYEAANALVILARRGFMGKEDAIRRLERLRALPTLSLREVAYGRAIELAIELGITLYDASYLALAIQTGAPLITADWELYERGRSAAKVIHASEVSP